MNLLEQFQTIRESAEHGLASALHFEAEGAELVRSFRPNERLILLGGGNIAQPLCRYAADLGFSVIVADDRPTFANRPRFPEAHTVYCDRFENAIDRIGIGEGDYVAVITRGHRYDADCLRKILRGTMPKYLGMIGSKRRTAGLLHLLEGEGFDRAQLDAIHTPIGLDIGALSVKEIAISIVAELIACRRANTNRRSHSSIMTSEDIDLPLLRYVADESIDKVLLLVYDTSDAGEIRRIYGGGQLDEIHGYDRRRMQRERRPAAGLLPHRHGREQERLYRYVERCGGKRGHGLRRTDEGAARGPLKESIVRLFLLYSGMGTLCVCPFSVQCTSLSCTNRPVQRRPPAFRKTARPSCVSRYRLL